MNLITPLEVDSRPVLNLARIHTRHEHGDLTVFSTWYGRNVEPCLVIFPTRFLGLPWDSHRASPAVVLLTQISIFMEDRILGDPVQAERIVSQFTEALLMANSGANRRRLRGLIASHLQDLVTIPPRPRENAEVRADAIMTDLHTGAVTEQEIRDDV